MRRVAVSVGVVALVGVLALIGVVAIPTGAAHALAPAPPPLSFPASAVPVDGTITPQQWNDFLRAHPEMYPSKAAQGAAAAKVGLSVAGGAVSGAGALLVGTQIGTGLAQTFGLPTSGSFFCDLGTLLGTSDCAVGAAPSYDPNSDVVVTAPGWAGGVDSVATYATHVISGGSQPIMYRAAVLEAPAIGQAGTLRWVLYPSAQPAGTNYFQRNYAVVRDAGTCSGVGSGSGIVPYPSESHMGAAPTGPGCVWHIQFTGNAGSSGPINWYPPGHALRPPDADPNPVRTWRSTWSCTSGPGGVASSPPFREGDVAWPSFPQATCGAGLVSHLVVEQVLGGQGTPVYTWDLPPEYVTSQQDHPQCAGGGCTLQLYRISGGRELSCFDNPGVCDGWWAGLSAEQKQSVTQRPAEGWGEFDGYECTYGGDPVRISDCGMYAPTFDVARPPGVDYAGPDGTVPPGGGDGGGGGGDDGDKGCPPPFTLMSLFNPWWYYKGAVCAGMALFKPSVAVGTVAAAISLAADETIIGPVSKAWDGLDYLAVNPDGCGVLFDTVPSQFLGQHFRVSTCDAMWSDYGHPLRNILGVGVIVSAIWGSVLLIMRSLGFYLNLQNSQEL